MTIAPMPRLRPLGLGQLLDQAIRLYRQNFFKFIGIIAIVQIPLGLLQLGTSLLTLDGIARLDDLDQLSSLQDIPGLTTGIGGSVLVAILGFVLLGVVATAAMTRAVAGSYLGEEVTIADAYRAVGQSWLSLLGALLLASLMGIALFLWFLVPCVGWLTGLGMITFFGMVIFPLIAPIIVLEKQKASRAVRRAWDLARRRFWWVLGFVLLLTIFAQVIITGPVLLVSAIFGLVFGEAIFEPSFTQSITQTIFQSLIQVVSSLIYLPLQLTAITLMYFDLRIRIEGFDLTLLAESVNEARPDVSALIRQAPQPEKGNLVTMTEIGYFVLIQLIAIILYILLVAVIIAIGAAVAAAAGVS